MIGSSATAATACRAVPLPPGAGVFPLRHRAVGRHRKVKLGDWRQPWLRVAGALLLVVSGEARIEVAGGDAVRAVAGDLFHFAPAERHAVSSEGGARILLTLAPWPGLGHYRGDERAGAIAS